MQFQAAAYTDTGNKKRVNQDGLNITMAHTATGDMAMLVVCDGVGGLSLGEFASAQAVRSYTRWFRERLPQIIAEKMLTTEYMEKEWRMLAADINQELLRYGEEHGTQLGTTLTAALVTQQEYDIIHIGDSRAYMLMDNAVQLTTDQTLINREIMMGHITPEQAQTDSRKHILLQCLGINPQIEPQFLNGEMMPEAGILLCTDGLSNRLDVGELYELVHMEEQPERNVMEQHLREITQLCRLRGEADNISVALLRSSLQNGYKG